MATVLEVDKLCDRFEAGWKAGQRPSLKDYLAQIDPARRSLLFRELLAIELAYRRQRGERPSPPEYEQAFLDEREAVRELFAAVDSSQANPAARLGQAGGATRPSRLADAGSDRNLLFGILALQMDFIRRDQLIEAMNRWVLAKHKPLAQILEELGALLSENRKLLEPLVAAHIRQHGDDPQRSLASLSSVEALRSELLQISDQDLAASLPLLAAGNGDLAATASLSPPGPSWSRFRILRPHAQGGLGRVFVAKDEELNREVALKEIQPQCAGDEAARSRFVLEAEITGGLEHPGIVPVYGLGAYPDGRPFYAMRFIKGDSLRSAIERFHAGGGQSPYRNPERQLELRQFLGRFIDVCQAVGYAHSRGVLHRDLKPGNIMLGKYGETLVVDWGLAKPKGLPEQASTLVSEGAFKPASGSSVEPTRMGMMIGTLQYMSPEQASGRHDLLGPATDIFSLGATLYHLLTGQPPYQGVPRDELEAAVQSSRFVPPRQVQPDIPPPLEAICLQAMARDPALRYASAQDLIADLEHYLADEPVTALAEPAVIRTRRWFRKRPALSATLAVSLLMGFVALGVGSLLVGRKNQELAKANADLVVARDEALTNEGEAVAQRVRADKNASEAQRETLRANEQSRLAGEREQAARWSAYVPAMNLGFQAWQSGYVGRAQRILEEQVPPAGQPDLRGPEWYFLWKQCHQEAAILRGHSGRVNDVAYSPDGKTLASVSDDGTVILWNVADRTLQRRIADHQSPVKSVVFSPTEPWMATAGNDGKVRFWDTQTWAQIRELSTNLRGNHHLHPLSLTVSPDGRRLVVGGSGGTQSYPSFVRVWDTTNWHELWSKEVTHSGIDISPDSQVTVVSEHSTKCRLYDLDDGRELAVYEDYSFAIRFTPSGDRILSSLRDFGRPKAYHRATGHLEVATTGHASWPRDLAIARSGATAALVGGVYENATMELWDVSRNEFVSRLSGHHGTIWSVAIAPDDREFATGGDDAAVRIWDGRWLEAGAATSGHTGALLAACFSPDGTLAATGCTDKIVCLWDARTGQCLRTLRQPERVFGLAFSPDGKWLAIASSSPVGDGLHVLSVESGREEIVPIGTIEALSVAFSADGTKLACGGRAGQVALLDAATLSLLATKQVHLTPIYAIAFCHDGKLLATGSGDNSSIVLDARSLERIQTMQGHTGAVRGVSFAADDQRLATASIDGTVKVWSLVSGTLVATLAKQPLPPLTYTYGLEYTADGKSLVAAFTMQYDTELWVFDAQTLTHTATVKFPSSTAYTFGLSHDGQQAITGFADGLAMISGLAESAPTLALGARPDCYSCAFSPDGARLAIGGYQTLSVVDLATRQVLFSRKAGTEPILNVAFFDDGRKIVTLECDVSRNIGKPSEVCVWDASNGEALASHTCSQDYGRLSLSHDHRQLALAGPAYLGGRAKSLEIWDLTSWKPLRTFPVADPVGYGCLAFSIDNQILASGEASYFSERPGRIALYVSDVDKPVAELRGHDSSVNGLAFVNGGKELVSAGNDSSLRVWDLKTGQLRKQLDVTRGGGIAGLAVIPDPERIVVACSAGPCLIWETRTWQQVGSFSLPGSSLSSVAASPDGRTLAVTSRTRLSSGMGYELFEIASLPEVASRHQADEEYAQAQRDRDERLRRMNLPRLGALDEAHARGDVSLPEYYLANRLLRSDPEKLNPADRESLALIESACDGTLAWNELPAKLAQVEPASQRTAREEKTAAEGRKAERERLIADLLAEARSNDSPDKAPLALDALARLLRFDPAHEEARKLQIKIAEYDPEEVVTNSLDMKLIEVRPARFWMGSPLEEEGRRPDEILHPVRLTQACYLGAYEVTRGQFATFVEASGYVTDAEHLAADYSQKLTWRQPGFDQAEDHPVVMVSWHDAQAFCRWLSEKEGRKYRLPTEAEWESACRAGTTTAYIWGQQADEGKEWGNLAGQERKGQPEATALFPWNDGVISTAPVGVGKANPWGFFDLIGNVSEWCHDQYQAYPLAIETDPRGGNAGTPPVVRGSSFASAPTASRSAFRHRLPASTSFPQVGFRVLLDTEP